MTSFINVYITVYVVVYLLFSCPRMKMKRMMKMRKRRKRRKRSISIPFPKRTGRPAADVFGKGYTSS